MKQISFLLILLVAIIGLGFHPNSYTVTFIPGSQETVENCVLVYKDNGQSKKVPGVAVNGKFEFKIETDIYRKAILSYAITTPDGRKAARNKPVVIEPGNVVIDCSGGDWAYSGTSFQDELNRFNNIALDEWLKVFPVEKSVDINNPLYSEKYKSFLKNRDVLWERYFEENKHPLVTAFVLENYVTSSWLNLDKAEYFFNRLPENIRTLPDIKEFGERLQNQNALRPGKMSPAFSLPNEKGEMVSLQSFKGKYLFIDFWASWCKPCREQSPYLVAAYKNYKSKGFDILSVSFDRTNDYQKWLDAAKKDGYTWTNVIDTAGIEQSPVGKLYNVRTIPKNVLLDKNGMIIAVNLEGKDLEPKLKEVME